MSVAFYHCSPISGLKLLEPRKPEAFDKPPRVYLTTLLPMALMYSIRNYEYTYGYRDGQIHFDEYFPNELEILYRGKSASLYLCAPESTETTQIPNEAVSRDPVPVLKEIFIPDACEALLEQARLGNLVIRRYHELPERAHDWIRKAEADCIREADLLNRPGEQAEYYRTHYPQSWAMVEQEQKK
jgi:hypothetical protein